jgi:hypothetical protein
MLTENVGSLRKNIDFGELLQNTSLPILLIAVIQTLDDNLKPELEGFVHPNLSKDLMKLKQKNKKVFDILSDTFKDIVDEFMSDALNELNINNSNLRDLRKINKVYYNGIKALAATQELYTLARIFKSTEYKNNIIYVGQAHLPFIIEVLKKLNYNIFYEDISNNYDENLRCVKALDFVKFFQD